MVREIALRVGPARRVGVQAMVAVCLLTSVFSCASVSLSSLEQSVTSTGAKISLQTYQPRSSLGLRAETSAIALQFIDRGVRLDASDRGTLVDIVRDLRPGKQVMIFNQTLDFADLQAESMLDEFALRASTLGVGEILFILTAGQSDHAWNPLALFYPTGIGYFLIPGTSYAAGISAQVVSLKTVGQPVLRRYRAEGSGSCWGPGFFIDRDCALNRAKQQVLEHLASRLASSGSLDQPRSSLDQDSAGLLDQPKVAVVSY